MATATQLLWSDFRRSIFCWSIDGTILLAKQQASESVADWSCTLIDIITKVQMKGVISPESSKDMLRNKFYGLKEVLKASTRLNESSTQWIVNSCSSFGGRTQNIWNSWSSVSRSKGFSELKTRPVDMSGLMKEMQNMNGRVSFLENHYLNDQELRQRTIPIYWAC